jgi:hypothetical protein
MITFLGLRIDLNWFYHPNDREIISRWTKEGSNEERDHALAIESKAPESSWSFLALGDTGDSDRFGNSISPQSAVATFMAQDCGLAGEDAAFGGKPPMTSPAHLVIHTGDINYLTGEERLYDINFIDPYRAFQTPESHFANLVFRVPFLPVPGNHDYYDLHGWLSKVMTASSWIGLSKVLTHFFYRLGLSVPLGGSDRGAAYMAAFVDDEKSSPQPLPYQPGVRTKLPNRYYQFRQGNVHFFALDSNTLDTPPPGAEDKWKENAPAIVERSEQRLGHLNEQVKRDRDWEEKETTRQREKMRAGELEELWPRLQQLLGDVVLASQALYASTEHWATATTKANSAGHSAEVNTLAADKLKELAKKERELHDGWQKVVAEAVASSKPVVTYESRLDNLINSQEAWLQHLATRDAYTVTLPAAPEYEAARRARLDLDASLGRWCRERVGAAMPGPCAEPACEEEETAAATEEEIDKVDLSEAILDTQRDLALARKLSERTDEDYDAAQIEWLRRNLEKVTAEEAELQKTDPNARIWRVVYMHHPLYTTLPSHTERSDSVGVRNNLQELLRDADVVVAGHSHGFEWLHSNAVPHQCYLVSGAGGMGRLQGSVFSPQLAERFTAAIESLTTAGLESLVWASGDPSPSGGTVEHKLFSYLRFHVQPDELRIEPVGVRQKSEAASEGETGWERIQPLPVNHVPDTKEWREAGAGETEIRHLQHIQVRRGEIPVAVWAE